MARIKMNVYFFQINGNDVRQASHETVVSHIRKSGDLVKLKVVTVGCVTSMAASDQLHQEQPGGGQPRPYSTLPRKMTSGRPPPPPKRDPTTTLSVGRARARSMVANLAAIGKH